jgi:hypothetical protein
LRQRGDKHRYGAGADNVEDIAAGGEGDEDQADRVVRANAMVGGDSSRNARAVSRREPASAGSHVVAWTTGLALVPATCCAVSVKASAFACRPHSDNVRLVLDRP